VEVDLHDVGEGTYPYQEQNADGQPTNAVQLNHLPRKGEQIWDDVNEDLWEVVGVTHPLSGDRTRVHIQLLTDRGPR